ncbi:hypothetical protein [Kribbella catacumbae]|uniref:hypothetical protein n=1 Tax=Kribbella catacumbae TaxID=460086 RepID=UPI0003A1B6FB|nr:hypothetical protein [Kribbella catacumbae]
MSFDRPGLNKPAAATDTDLNEALEKGELDESGLNVDNLEHDDGQRAPGPVDDDQRGPVDDEERRPPRDQDVSYGEKGTPVEPPD